MSASPIRHLEALCCPDDRHALSQAASVLRCEACGRTFHTVEGIACLMPVSGWSVVEQADADAEMRRRDHEAARYDRLLGLWVLSPVEVPLTLGPLRVGNADRVVEVGCGTGRLTTHLGRRGAGVVSVDHSLESLRILRSKLDAAGLVNVQLIQGDATALPIRSGWATRALAPQVVEHIPTSGMRSAAIRELARVLEEGGRAAVSVYWHTPGLRWLLLRDGKHSGEICFHRFERAEFAELLAHHLEVEEIRGCMAYTLIGHAHKRQS